MDEQIHEKMEMMGRMEENVMRWMTEENKLLQGFKKFPEHDISKHEEHLHSLISERKRLTKLEEEEKNSFHRKKEELVDLEKELNRLLQETESREEEIKLTQSSLDKTSADKQIIKQKIEASQKQVTVCLEELQKMEEIFQERLGLKFVKTPDKKLQIVFTNIDPDDPCAPFSLDVQVIDDIYRVSNAKPEIKDLDVLAAKLNDTKSFRSFILSVRKYFCRSIQDRD